MSEYSLDEVMEKLLIIENMLSELKLNSETVQTTLTAMGTKKPRATKKSEEDKAIDNVKKTIERRTVNNQTKKEYQEDPDAFVENYQIEEEDYNAVKEDHPDAPVDQFKSLYNNKKYKEKIYEIYVNNHSNNEEDDNDETEDKTVKTSSVTTTKGKGKSASKGKGSTTTVAKGKGKGKGVTTTKGKGSSTTAAKGKGKGKSGKSASKKSTKSEKEFEVDEDALEDDEINAINDDGDYGDEEAEMDPEDYPDDE